MKGDTVSLWLDLAKELELFIALVFLLGVLAGLILSRRRDRSHADYLARKQSDASLPKRPNPTPAEIEELIRFHDRAQKWPRIERK